MGRLRWVRVALYEITNYKLRITNWAKSCAIFPNPTLNAG